MNTVVASQTHPTIGRTRHAPTVTDMHQVSDYTRELYERGLLRDGEKPGTTSAHLQCDASRPALEIAARYGLSVSTDSRTMATLTDRHGNRGTLVNRHWNTHDIASGIAWALSDWDHSMRSGRRTLRALSVNPPAQGLEEALSRLGEDTGPDGLTSRLPQLAKTLLDDLQNQPYANEPIRFGHIPAATGALEIAAVHINDILSELGAAQIWLGHFAPPTLSSLIRAIANDPTLLRRSVLLQGPPRVSTRAPGARTR